MTEASRSGPPAIVPEQDDRQPEHVAGPFECFGQGFIIRTPDADLAGFLNELYEPLRIKIARDLVTYSLLPPRPGTPGRLSSDRGLVRTSPSHDRLLTILVWAINRQVIDGPSAHRLIFHAAAAELHGAGVLLPAPTRSGKTTLVTALLDRGFAYLTDEAAAVDDDLTIEGFPKPLSVERSSFEVLGNRRSLTPAALAPYLQSQRQLPVARFATVVRRSRLAMIVFPRYVAGGALRLEPVSAATAAATAFTNVFSPEGQPAPAGALASAIGIVERVPAFSLIHGDAQKACERIVAELNESDPRP